MTTIRDLIGDQADDLARFSLSVGDIHRLPLGVKEEITPKDGKDSRDKFFIVLGFDNCGNAIGGVVVNSNINPNLPTTITDYLMPVSTTQLPFLHHNSYINCSHLVVVNINKFNKNTFRWHLDNGELLQMIIGTLYECPIVNKQQLKEFSVIVQQD